MISHVAERLRLPMSMQGVTGGVEAMPSFLQRFFPDVGGWEIRTAVHAACHVAIEASSAVHVSRTTYS